MRGRRRRAAGEPAGDAGVDALGEDRRDERREGDGHREAVPEEGRVVWRPMVVSRAEGRGGDGGKEECIRAPLPRLVESVCRTRRGDDGQSPESDGEKRKVRQDVERVRHRAERDRVGEEVVVLRLLFRRDREDGEEKDRGGGAKRGEAADHIRGHDTRCYDDSTPTSCVREGRGRSAGGGFP